MKLRVWWKALLCGFGITMKVDPDKFHLLLSDKKVITWIFVMRSFQVCTVKSFSGLKLIISLLLRKPVKNTAQKSQTKSQCCGMNFIFNEI